MNMIITPTHVTTSEQVMDNNDRQSYRHLQDQDQDAHVPAPNQQVPKNHTHMWPLIQTWPCTWTQVPNISWHKGPRVPGSMAHLTWHIKTTTEHLLLSITRSSFHPLDSALANKNLLLLHNPQSISQRPNMTMCNATRTWRTTQTHIEPSFEWHMWTCRQNTSFSRGGPFSVWWWVTWATIGGRDHHHLKPTPNKSTGTNP